MLRPSPPTTSPVGWLQAIALRLGITTTQSAVIAVVVLYLVASGVVSYWRRPDEVAAPTPAAMERIATAAQRRAQNDVTGAVALLTDALRFESDPATTRRIYADRAYAYKMAADWEASIADLTSALEVTAGLADAERIALLNDRAWAYVVTRDLDRAIADYETLLPVDDAACKVHPLLVRMITPRFRRDVPFFVFTESAREDLNGPRAIPPPIAALVRRFDGPLNLEFWWYRIPAPQLRYTDPQDAMLAAGVAGALRSQDFYVDGPVLFAGTTRSRRIEIWFPRETDAVRCWLHRHVASPSSARQC